MQRGHFNHLQENVRYIINEISDNIRSQTDRNHALTPTDMVLLTLRFLACGSFLQINGDIMGVDKATANRAIDNVTRVQAGLAPHFIKMPSDIHELNVIERCFGIWKRHFYILALGISLSVQMVEAIVVATAVLHNIALAMMTSQI
ncbi:transforming growth factor-beta receptor type i and ii [Holotrichia oblita]|uniref:Transforming growth factor-beta receptor type i and ii n=1 Tax=Holotrichia oblita TaxID=644536 RepID=A0ACB9SWU9_HOLOL|nr:transforming growth factor-beta receptor type i and ii [Holotrichia oblita]